MKHTGRYVYDEVTHQVVKVSDDIPSLARAVYVPKGDVPYYDRGLRMHIESKAQKRQVLFQRGLREGGVIRNPEKDWRDEIASLPSTRPSAQACELQRRTQAAVRLAGGVANFREQLLKRQAQGGR